jgi:hypothetical protein
VGQKPAGSLGSREHSSCCCCSCSPRSSSSAMLDSLVSKCKCKNAGACLAEPSCHARAAVAVEAGREAARQPDKPAGTSGDPGGLFAIARSSRCHLRIVRSTLLIRQARPSAAPSFPACWAGPILLPPMLRPRVRAVLRLSLPPYGPHRPERPVLHSQKLR